MKKNRLNIIILFFILIMIFASGCSLFKNSPEFSEKDFIAELENCVSERKSEIVYTCQNSDDIKRQIENALDMAYNQYIIGENVENIAWSIQEFLHTNIKFEIEYRDKFTDLRQEAIPYSPDRFYQKIEEAVLKKESVNMILSHDGSLEDAILEESIREILRDNDSALINYYCEHTQYTIKTYADYASVEITIAYSENTIPYEMLAAPQNTQEAITELTEQWDNSDTAVLYYPDGIENPSEFCEMLINTATANDADDPYLCTSCEWMIYGREDHLVSIRKIYYYDSEKLAEMRQNMLTEAKSIAENLTITDEKEKIKEIGKILTDRIDYDKDLAKEITSDSEISHEANIRRTAYGALIDGETVCSGYARAMKLVCDYAGIDCFVIDGTVKNEGHEWNMVFIDGEAYYVDLTFADTSHSSKYCLFDKSLYEKEGYSTDEKFFIPQA